MIKRYYSLIKPGVLYGNALTAAAGFLLASAGRIHWGLFIFLMLGTTLVIGSACALNNYLDRDIDAHMERTKSRATVTGAVPARNALLFAIIIGIVGAAILIVHTNWLVIAIGAIGFVDYVWFYGAWSKRQSVHGTLVGSISGATPVLAGYCAARGRIDAGAIIVFAALFLWQQPEFYSISIYRRKEYAAAGVPVMAVIKGVKHTKLEILIYTLAFVIVSLLLTPFGYTGYTYLAVMAALGLYWVWLGTRGQSATDDDAWAKKMFRWSLIMILAFSAMMAVGSVLP